MADWFALITQTAFAVAGLDLLRRSVFSALRYHRHPKFYVDVWGPIVLILPMLFFASRVDFTVQGVGWVSIGGPIVCGLIAVGAAMLAGTTAEWAAVRVDPQRLRLFTSLAGASLLLFMLGSANDLTLWMGQCAFAIGAVLMWMNTPEIHTVHDKETRHETMAGFGLFLALLCAIGQGFAARFVPVESAAISAGVTILYGTMAVVMAGSLGGAQVGIRIGGWAAVYGVFLAIGLISVLRLFPEVINVFKYSESGRLNRVAYGFGQYAWESSALILTMAAVYSSFHVASRTKRAVFGFFIVTIGAVLAAARISSI